ncbi:MAG: right-handed parallel beta-helix repeat-containing protein, partial [Thermoplasmata archaeon]
MSKIDKGPILHSANEDSYIDIWKREKVKRVVQILAVFSVAIMITTTWAGPVNKSVEEQAEKSMSSSNKPTWTVKKEEDIVKSNMELTVNGNLIVKRGGKLTLDQVILKMNSTKNGEYSIVVEEGGTLMITDSEITAANPLFRYKFLVFGSMIMQDSQVNCLWGSKDEGSKGKGGIQIHSDDVVISGSTISNSQTSGIYISKAAPSITHNEIFDCEYGIFSEGTYLSMVSTQTLSNGAVKKTTAIPPGGWNDYSSFSLPKRANVISASFEIQNCIQGPRPGVAITNLALDIGSDGDIEWSDASFTGKVTLDEENAHVNLSLALNQYIWTHEPDAEGNIIIPLNFSSSSGGEIKISHIKIHWVIQSTISHNIVRNNTYGLYFKSTPRNFGQSTAFSDGSVKKSLTIQAGGWSSGASLYLPKYADVIDASFEIKNPDKIPISDLAMDIGADGDIEWSSSNFKKQSKIDDGNTEPKLTDKLNQYAMTSEADGEGNVIVPLAFSSSSGGKIEVSKIRIRYAVQMTIIGNIIEENTYGVYSTHSYLTLVNNTVLDNDCGILSDFSYLVLIDLALSSITYNLYLEHKSTVITYNITFDKRKVHVDDPHSILMVKFYLTVMVIDSEGQPMPAVNVVIKDRDMNQVYSGETAITGKTPAQIITGYTQTATGFTFPTPHTIFLPNGGNEVDVVVDATKDAMLYFGGDSDIDLIPDTEENSHNVYWFEAEHHVFDKSQVRYDFAASNVLAVVNRTDSRIVIDEFFLTVPAGTYKLFVRAKSVYETGAARMSMSLGDGTTTMIMDDTHLLKGHYAWYSTPLFTLIAKKSGDLVAIEAAIEDVTSTQANDITIRVDMLMLARLADAAGLPTDTAFGQITDPLDIDTDDDRLIDSLEVRSDTFWFEGEDFPATGPSQIVDDLSAGNSKAVTSSSADPNTFRIVTMVPTSGTYRLYVKAANAQGKAGQLDLKVDSTVVGTVSLSDEYQWYHADGSIADTSIEHILEAEDVGMSPPTCLVDKVIFAKLGSIELTEIVDELGNLVASTTLSFAQPNDMTKTLHLRVPIDSLVSSATLKLHSQDDLESITLVDGAGDQHSPSIYGHSLVYVDDTSGNSDIYCYDLSMDSDGDGIPNFLESPRPSPDPAMIQITTDSYNQINPEIYENHIVWQDDRNGNYDIYSFDLNSGSETQITTDTANQVEPHIFGNSIVWEDDSESDTEIYIHYIREGQNSKITDDGIDQHKPRIHGEKLVWVEGTLASTGTVLYDLSMWADTYE